MSHRILRYSFILIVAVLFLATLEPLSFTADGDEASTEIPTPDYGEMFGPQSQSRLHHGLQRRFARDVQDGLLSVSIFLVPGSDVVASTRIVLTKVDDELVEIDAADLVIDEEKWYLVARLDPIGNVRVFSVRIDSPPLEGAFVKVRNREWFAEGGNEPSLAIFELSEDIDVPGIMTLAYHPIGYFEL
jgi:hypothetical protein